MHHFNEVSSPPGLPEMKAHHSFASLIHNIPSRDKVPTPISRLLRGEEMDALPRGLTETGWPQGVVTASWSHCAHPKTQGSTFPWHWEGVAAPEGPQQHPRAAWYSSTPHGKSLKSRGTALSRGVPLVRGAGMPYSTSSPSSSGCSPG